MAIFFLVLVEVDLACSSRLFWFEFFTFLPL